MTYTIRVRFGLTKRVGTSRNKRLAIRRCRALVKGFPWGASDEVRREGVGLIYQCHSIEQDGKAVLRVDEL